MGTVNYFILEDASNVENKCKRVGLEFMQFYNT